MHFSRKRADGLAKAWALATEPASLALRDSGAYNFSENPLLEARDLPAPRRTDL